MSVESTVVTGDLTDRYVLDHPLRVGGMGVVWVAHSKALNIPVALKILRSREGDAEAVERMANEAHAAASLGHPAIVRVLDFGDTGGAPFIAMELLEGEDLAGTLQREGRIPPTEAVGLLLPIIDGLATAHARGIVHRDIKPENIFIARDAMGRVQPKVLDFGIAKLEDARSTTRLTRSGTLLGTLQYLSPEQAYGRDDVDFRTDIWSMGIVLYELIAGSQPFGGKTHNAVIRSITEDEFRRTPAIADEQLWRILDRCLKKEADDRWESMWALGEALALWLLEHGIDVDAASRSLREGWLESGVSGVLMEVPEAVDSLPTRAALLCPPPPSARARTSAQDPIARAVVMTVKRGRAGSARHRVRRVVGAALLLGLPSGFLAFHQPPAYGGGHAGRPVARATQVTPEVQSPPSSREPAGVRQQEPPAPEPVLLGARQPPRPTRALAKRAATPKLPTADPEFGF